MVNRRHCYDCHLGPISRYGVVRSSPNIVAVMRTFTTYDLIISAQCPDEPLQHPVSGLSAGVHHHPRLHFVLHLECWRQGYSTVWLVSHCQQYAMWYLSIPCSGWLGLSIGSGQFIHVIHFQCWSEFSLVNALSTGMLITSSDLRVINYLRTIITQTKENNNNLYASRAIVMHHEKVYT